jgi:pimeloyl-ACP methyl ester carboxylesterase
MKHPGINRRRFTACMLATAAWPLAAQEAVPFQIFEFDWGDPARARAVPVRLYWPHGAALQGRVPLVAFSHGIGGSRRGYSYLGQHWAANGLASLHLQHVGSDRNLWFGNPLGLVGRLHDAAQEHEAMARAQDLRFALDRLLGAGSAFAARIDAERIVVAGHSYGANTALLAAGARVERQGQVVDLREPRVRAAIVLSAPPFYGEADPSRILAPVTVPSLHVTATGDVIRIPGYYSGADDRVVVFEATGSAAKALAVFDGGSHSMFTDRAGTGGTELNPLVKAATRELSLAFVGQIFGQGDTDAMSLWAERHRAILARFVGIKAPALA